MNRIALIAVLLLACVSNAETPSFFGGRESPRLKCLVYSLPGCEPCRRMKAEYAKELSPLGWKIEFIDAQDDVKYFDSSRPIVPQIVVVSGRDKLAAWYGYSSPERLAAWLNSCASETTGGWK